MIRQEFTGMLPGAIAKFEALLTRMSALKPKIPDVAVDPKLEVSKECKICPLLQKETEALESSAAELSKPKILKGYDTSEGKNSYFSWGVACRIHYVDMAALRTEAEALGITWLSEEGDMAYTGGLKIADFKTFRVNGTLKLASAMEKEVK